MKTTLSFDFEGSYPEVIAQIKDLLAKLDPPAIVVETAKVRAPRAKRLLTEAERQAIRERLAAGKAKAAKARGEAVIPARIVDYDPETVQQPKVFEVKPDSNHTGRTITPAPKPFAKKPAAKVLPMPAKGRKVEAKPSAQ